MNYVWKALPSLFVLTTIGIGADVAANKQEEQAIRKVLAEWNEAWSKHDGSEPARFYAEDATFTTPGGTFSKGLNEIAKETASAHARVLKGSVGQFKVDHVQFLTPQIAVIDGPFDIAQMTAPSGRTVSRSVRQTLVMERRTGAGGSKPTASRRRRPESNRSKARPAPKDIVTSPPPPFRR